MSSTTLWVSPRIPLGFFFLFNQTLEETSGAKRWTQARKAADVHFKWCISNLNFSPAAPFSASWPWICSTEDGWADALLYLRHLGEQADGHGQRQAEGNQAHHAVDGQQQSAMALQKSQPTRVKTGIKKNTKRQTWAFCVDRSRATAASYSWIRKKKPHVRIRGSYFPQLVGGRFICLRQSPSSLFNESDWTYPLLFIITEIEILFLFTDFFVFGNTIDDIISPSLAFEPVLFVI